MEGMTLKLFLYLLFFNGDPAPGYLPDLFDLQITGEEPNFIIQSIYPFWILPAVAIGLAIAAYFIGSINFALVISKVVYHDDVRKYGSHNAGTTNMKRTFGMKAAILTLAGDILKGVITVLAARLLISQNAAYLAGFCCILGHCFPAYFKFRGGKGVATAFAVVLTLDPLVALILFGIFALVALGSKYISLGSIMAAFFFPMVLDRMYNLLFHEGPTALMVVCSILIMILVILMHHGNIKRLIHGEENKFYLRKKPAGGKGDSSSGKKSEKGYRSLHQIDDEDEDEEDGGDSDGGGKD